ncbi:MAG: hypothetical protein ACRD9S_22095 [Pyrinomonadaceae bacterium]
MTKTISAAAVGLAVCLSVMAVPKVNFNGAWIMDRNRSFGIPRDLDSTMTVKQSEDQIEVETKLIQTGSERTLNDTYIFDGKEHDFNPPAPPNAPADAPKPKGKRTSAWLPDGKGILLTELVTNETPQGPVTTQMLRKWSFTGENELTVTTFVDGPRGSYEAKRIFLRK